MADCALQLSPVSGPAQGEAGPVHYHSLGRVLILADGPIEIPTSGLEAPGPISMLVPGTHQKEQSAAADGPRLLSGRLIEVRGWLGHFAVKFSPLAPGLADRAEQAGGRQVTEEFDLIIDLMASPAIVTETPPIGYFRANAVDDLAAILARCRELVGHFSKPRYFRYDVSICAHESFGTPGCTRCLDVCSADAIVSEGSKIAVNPHLCQGCASCTLACPTGALSYAWPSRENLLHRVAALLKEAAVGSTILVHPRSVTPDIAGLAGGIECFPIEALPAMGEEIWFAALALGAGRVALLADSDTPEESLALLSTRVSQARQMLGVCRVDPDAILLVRDAEALAGIDAPRRIGPSVGEDRLASATRYKRLLLNQALSWLGADSEMAASSLDASAPMEAGADSEKTAAPLESGAAWGRIVIDPDKCTQCSACAEVCPTLAIRYFEDAEQASAEIGFNEQRCVQCGICASACPEDAIHLEPRFAGARESESWPVVATGALARCTECRRAFIPEKMLEVTLDSIRSKGKLNDDIERQLRRCPECRAQHLQPD